jgi:hypothetical protein
MALWFGGVAWPGVCRTSTAAGCDLVEGQKAVSKGKYVNEVIVLHVLFCR